MEKKLCYQVLSIIYVYEGLATSQIKARNFNIPLISAYALTKERDNMTKQVLSEGLERSFELTSARYQTLVCDFKVW